MGTESIQLHGTAANEASGSFGKRLAVATPYPPIPLNQQEHECLEWQVFLGIYVGLVGWEKQHGETRKAVNQNRRSRTVQTGKASVARSRSVQ